MVEALLKRVLAKRANKLPSFVLIVGDEESDDHMFKVGVICVYGLIVYMLIRSIRTRYLLVFVFF